MDLSFSKEEMAFREEVRAFFRDNVPPETRRKLVEGRHLVQGRDGRLVAHPEQEGLGRLALAEGIWRHRLDLGAALHLQRGAADASGAGAARLRRQHGRPGDLHLRQRGAEEAIPAAHRQCRRLVVPGLFRARLRLRPRLAEDQGRAQGRQIHRQRPEDLDHAGAARRHDLLPVPHRSQRQEADGHLLHPDRHEVEGHHGAPDPDHRRRPRGQRSVLRRRRGAGREPGRRGEQGLGLRQIPARQRAHRHRPRRRLQGAHPPHQGTGRRRSNPAASR